MRTVGLELVTHEKQERRETKCKALWERRGHEKVVREQTNVCKILNKYLTLILTFNLNFGSVFNQNTYRFYHLSC